MENKKWALITGASRGLGFKLAQKLAENGWQLLITARNATKLLRAKKALSAVTNVLAVRGDVKDEIHLLELGELLEQEGISLDLVVNNASELGASPLVNILDHPVEQLHEVFHTNVIAPFSLLQKIKRQLSKDARIINVSSDAAVEAYETWGAYGGSKAALDHMTAIFGKENPNVNVYSFDPGDMRTDMHQAAFPGENISDRPLPEVQAVPALWTLINSGNESGRYTIESLKMQAV